MDQQNEGPVLVSGYPQLCGLCGCVNIAHTPDHCKNCGPKNPHAYVRTDVLACTLLHEIGQRLDGIGRLMMKAMSKPDSPIVKLH